jgi:hypothetical protein
MNATAIANRTNPTMEFCHFTLLKVESFQKTGTNFEFGLTQTGWPIRWCMREFWLSLNFAQAFWKELSIAVI